MRRRLAKAVGKGTSLSAGVPAPSRMLLTRGLRGSVLWRSPACLPVKVVSASLQWPRWAQHTPHWRGAPHLLHTGLPLYFAVKGLRAGAAEVTCYDKASRHCRTRLVRYVGARHVASTWAQHLAV